MSYDTEAIVTIAVLLALTGVYLYLLFSPSQPHLAKHAPNVVIQRDSLENFQRVMEQVRGGYSQWRESKQGDWGVTGAGRDDFFVDGNGTYEWGQGQKEDDFFLDGYSAYSQADHAEEEEPLVPLVPSDKFLCSEDWVSIRSEMNYRFLWMHGSEERWMGASATMDTPLYRKAFLLHPVEADCAGGWVLLQEGDSPAFVMMVNPNQTTDSIYDREAWVVKVGTEDKAVALADPSYHFLLEDEGFVLNRGALACVNVMAEHEYMVRGHTSGWNTHRPAGREFGAMVKISVLDRAAVDATAAQERAEGKLDHEADSRLLAQIAAFPTSAEKRVISFGLYGAKPKYTTGAIRNAELAGTYFPGWVCRFYVTSDVPVEVLSRLKGLGAEIENVPSGMGYTSGMFWRFMVASDATVDRYIVRDSDSRLNARDRIAVEEWIRSGQEVHIQRDHVNHCIVMNGGMWGGTKAALPEMRQLVEHWEARNEYMADLHFLEQRVWPVIKHKQLAHDAYCCDRYPHTRPYPTRRAFSYQHVGQVFDEADQPRLTDIDGFIRGVPTPSSCRKDASWIYG